MLYIFLLRLHGVYKKPMLGLEAATSNYPKFIETSMNLHEPSQFFTKLYNPSLHAPLLTLFGTFKHILEQPIEHSKTF